MLNLGDILKRSYFYTKNHTYLWFFGFFVSGSGLFGLSKIFDLNAKSFFKAENPHALYLFTHPERFAIVIIAFLFVFLGLTAISVFGRTAIISSAFEFEKKHDDNFWLAFKQSSMHFKNTYIASVILIAVIAFVGLWLFIPVTFVYTHGYEFRGIVLLLLAILIFAPIFAILSLVSIFANCFIVGYKMHILDAIKAGFDLLSHHWVDAVSLLFFLWLLYVLLFFVTASFLGFLGILAYGIAVLLKSLLIPVFLLLHALFVLAVALVLVIVNTFLNTYSNIVWTIFFIKVVKAAPGKHEKAALHVAEPIR